MHHTQYQSPPPHPSLLPRHIMSASSPHLLMSPHPPPPQQNTFPPSNNSQHSFYTPCAPHPQVRQTRRYKTVKRLVQIPQGKLVLNCPVPIQYLERVPLRDPREFNMMRYTGFKFIGKVNQLMCSKICM